MACGADPLTVATDPANPAAPSDGVPLAVVPPPIGLTFGRPVGDWPLTTARTALSTDTPFSAEYTNMLPASMLPSASPLISLAIQSPLSRCEHNSSRFSRFYGPLPVVHPRGACKPGPRNSQFVCRTHDIGCDRRDTPCSVLAYKYQLPCVLAYQYQLPLIRRPPSGTHSQPADTPTPPEP